MRGTLHEDARLEEDSFGRWKGRPKITILHVSFLSGFGFGFGLLFPLGFLICNVLLFEDAV